MVEITVYLEKYSRILRIDQVGGTDCCSAPLGEIITCHVLPGNLLVKCVGYYDAYIAYDEFDNLNGMSIVMVKDKIYENMGEIDYNKFNGNPSEELQLEVVDKRLILLL